MYEFSVDRDNSPFPDLPRYSYSSVYGHFLNSRIPDKMIYDSLVLKPYPVDLASFKKLKSIQNNIVDFVSEGKSISISSQYTGNGKTTWAVKLLKQYIHDNYMTFSICGYFCSIPEFADMCKKDNKSLAEVINIMSVCDLLILDDIAFMAPLPESCTSKLLLIMNNRVNNSKSTIVTSNAPSGESLKLCLGNLLYSRIYANANHKIEFYGQDRRGE